jgi:hypothetical protein
LDALYDYILTAAYCHTGGDEQGDIQKVLRAVITVRNPLSINGLSMLLELDGSTVCVALSSLHSVINVPPSNDRSRPVSILHASFPDYLTTNSRSGNKFLDPSEAHQFLALHCLALLQSSLKGENICHLKGRPPNTDIPASEREKYIPEGLAYACTYWCSHVSDTRRDCAGIKTLDDALLQFFHTLILKWVECLSILGQLDVAVNSLRRLEGWAQVCKSSHTHDKIGNMLLSQYLSC